jgi:hypothetical protein
MPATLEKSPVGRLWIPEFERVTFGAARRVEHRSKYIGVVTYEVRDRLGRRTQAGYGLGVTCDEGLTDAWNRNPDLQKVYRTPADMIAALRFRAQHGNVALPAGIVHNERVNNGGAALGSFFFGNSLSPSNGTVNAPNRIALCNLSSFAAATGDLSLGTATPNVTTNEQTANGLGRTTAVTPTSVVAQTALDGNASDQIVHTFTDSTATSTTYGSALVDNTTTTFNMFAEATYSTAVTNVGDTLLVTWSRAF